MDFRLRGGVELGTMVAQGALTRCSKAVQAGSRRWADLQLRRFYPEIETGYSALAEGLGTPIKFTRQAERGVFLLNLMVRHKPSLIVELGSGASTIWFAAYARRHGARVVSLEQDPDWCQAVRRAVPSADIILSSLKSVGESVWRYEADMPDGADLIYVDGPSGKRFLGTKRSSAKKMIYWDTLDYLARGQRPKLIVVDSRTETVCAIRKVTAAEYSFAPQCNFAIRTSAWGQALRFRRQSVFVRRD